MLAFTLALDAGIADFFVSRSTPRSRSSSSDPTAPTTTTSSGAPTASGTLSIKNVVPPDEFAIGFPLYSGVSDSVGPSLAPHK